MKLRKIIIKKKPWATAKALTYQVGKGTPSNGLTGKSFRDNHPLKGIGTKVGTQVFKEDLLDLTTEFNALVINGIPGFGKIKNKSSDGYLGAKSRAFRGLVSDGAKYDLKAENTTDGTPSYAAKVVGEWSILNGTLRRYDDYGNISYGIFGKAAKFTDNDLYSGSHLNQVWKNTFGRTNGSGEKNNVRRVNVCFGKEGAYSTTEIFVITDSIEKVIDTSSVINYVKELSRREKKLAPKDSINDVRFSKKELN